MIIFKHNALKLSKNEKEMVKKSLYALESKIIEIEKYGTQFEKIFNNDSVKYDCLGNNFFTYKAHGIDKSQIRILYRFVRKDSMHFDIECHDVEIKRRPGKEYIRKFEEYARSY